MHLLYFLPAIELVKNPMYVCMPVRVCVHVHVCVRTRVCLGRRRYLYHHRLSC